jgi:hypothetical protein
MIFVEGFTESDGPPDVVSEQCGTDQRQPRLGRGGPWGADLRAEQGFLGLLTPDREVRRLREAPGLIPE